MLGKRIAEAVICGEPCYIRSLSSGKSSVRVLELLQQVGENPTLFLELGSLLVLQCHCGPTGIRTYTDDQLAEIQDEASFAYLQEFAQRALEISGLGDDAEAVRKNLSAAP